MLHRMETPAHQCLLGLVVTLKAARTNHPISLQVVPVYIYIIQIQNDQELLPDQSDVKNPIVI